jgi:hypothetical protein
MLRKCANLKRIKFHKTAASSLSSHNSSFYKRELISVAAAAALSDIFKLMDGGKEIEGGAVEKCESAGGGGGGGSGGTEALLTNNKDVPETTAPKTKSWANKTTVTCNSYVHAAMSDALQNHSLIGVILQYRNYLHIFMGTNNLMLLSTVFRRICTYLHMTNLQNYKTSPNCIMLVPPPAIINVHFLLAGSSPDHLHFGQHNDRLHPRI